MDVLVSSVFGPLAVVTVQRLKAWLRLRGIAALWLTMAVSLVYGLAAALLTGKIQVPSLEDPVQALQVLAQDWAVVFGVATVIYRYVKEKQDGSSEGTAQQ